MYTGDPDAHASTKPACGDASTSGCHPLAAVMRNAIYAPLPRAKQFEDARAAGDPASIAIKLSFCVTTSGRTKHIEVVGPDDYPAYAKILTREVVRRWRFEPFLDEGRAVMVCTRREFVLEFS